jgi:DNA primase
MIPQPKVEEIINASRIEEVVGDYVNLKKRGANLLGLCPFHNEKTPSFTVSPAKGIYKCFGCGKAGDSVRFIMEHDSLSYPDALKYLANKYNIEVEEIKLTDEALQSQNERESVLIALKFASDYFTQQLWEDEEGQTIGLSYFEERGFRHEIIRKFGLGYSKEGWNHFYDHAIASGYKEEFLKRAGLITVTEQGKIFDLFRGRVMFPVHDLSGRVVAFGGRIMKKDPKAPKYVNSPETEVYHKSDILYGYYFAKQEIRKHDRCYLVEGYTDVITLHQGGIENVVASSGTSLTEGQIKLIKRFTENVTILYDGDQAGLKASLRGVDMILEQGLNVKVVTFPEGEDPDSYCKSQGGEAFAKYIRTNEKDFIIFKSNLLLAEAANDPVKRAEVIRNIVESISKIPDSIKRSVFVKECSKLLDISEQVLINELNKIFRNRKKEDKELIKPTHEESLNYEELLEQNKVEFADENINQEANVIEVLIKFGNVRIEEKTLAEIIISAILDDQINFRNPVYNKVFVEFCHLIDNTPSEKWTEHFINYKDENIAQKMTAFLIDDDKYLLTKRYSQAESRIHISEMLLQRNMKEHVEAIIFHFKRKRIDELLTEFKNEVKNAYEKGEDYTALMPTGKYLLDLRKEIFGDRGTVIVK